ncbi:MAG: peptidylprolyl isomerase [Rhodospirillales bacterium]|nr:peptidylprolyl isomerase [Rhodospirillales bacterium]
MRLLAFATAALALVLAALPLAVQAQDSAEDPLVATVNGEKIYRSEVLETAKSLPAQYQQQLDQIFPTLVERIVDFRLLAAAASEAKLEEDEEVKRRMEELRKGVLREVYLERQIAERVTDEALQGSYQDFIAANPPQAEIKASHILLEDEAAAKEVISELDGGADFAELAKERSTGPSGPNGGDLGFFTADQMVPEFSQAAFALEPGKHSAAPVQTQFGWHVIKVMERREGAAPPFEELQDQLRDEASREVVNAVLTELREEATVEIADPLPPPAEAAQ